MKKILMIMLAVVVLALASCTNNASNENSLADNSVFTIGEDDQPFYTSRTAIKLSNGEGYYFWHINRLYYYDKITKSCVIVCSKPDCEHKDYELNGENNSCNAYLPSDEYYFEKGYAYYNGSIYVLGQSSKDEYTVSLNRISSDGAVREEICEMFTISDWNDIGEFTVHRGYAFCSLRTSENTSSFYSVNISDKSVSIVCEIKGYAAEIDRMVGYGKYMYFSKSYAEDKELENWNGKICRFDIETGKIDELLNNLGYFCVLNDNVYYINYGKYKKIYVYNTKDKTTSELADTPGDSKIILTDGENLYISNFDNETIEKKNIKIFIMSSNGELMDEVSVPSCQLFEGGDNDFMFIETNEGSTQAFDKSQIGTGKYEWKTVFSVSDTGEVILNE